MDITEKKTNGEIIDTWWTRTKKFFSNKITLSILSTIMFIIMVVTLVNIFNSVPPSKEAKSVAKSINTIFGQTLEQAYFEGQRDYMNGKVCIEQTIDGNMTHYKWVKSPWNNGTKATYKLPSEKTK